jgi:guanine deaminase
MSTQPDPELMRRAIALATENVVTGKGGPFGALVVRNGAIIGEGANTVTATNDPTAHAEVNAIRASAKALGTFTLAGCELYTSCEPCPMCLAAAHWARIDAIYYAAGAEDAARGGFDDAFLYGEFRKDTVARRLPERQLLRDEAWRVSRRGLLLPKRFSTDCAKIGERQPLAHAWVCRRPLSIYCTVTGPTDTGVPAPALFTAATLNVYALPEVSPPITSKVVCLPSSTTMFLPVNVTLRPPGLIVTS